MRNTLFALMIFATLVIPSSILAGQGATNLYCSWFNDSDYSGSSSTTETHRFTNWIHVSNPNSTQAILKICYYEPDGSIFNNTSSFTHIVPTNGSIAWKPNNDLNISPAEEVKGSYAIKVIEGSVTADNVVVTKAGNALPNIDAFYVVNDPLCMHSLPVETTPSTYLTCDGFICLDQDQDDILEAGESITWFHINNQSDSITAKVNIKFYDQDGGAYTLDPSNVNDDETYTKELQPHETFAFKPTTFGIYDNGSGGAAKGNVVLDVINGSVIASYAKILCDGGLKTPPPSPNLDIYKAAGFGFNKLIVQP